MDTQNDLLRSFVLTTLLTRKTLSASRALAAEKMQAIEYFQLQSQDREPISCPIADLYTLHKQLGHGGYSTVWKGTCKKTKEPRALKCLKTRGQEEYFRATREYQILRRLNHPNILKVFSFVQDTMQSKYYIASEHCDGGNLLDAVNLIRQFNTSAGLQSSDLANYFLQMLRGLFHVHQLQIAHRDVKPDNFMLTSYCGANDLKLIDFGLAKDYSKKGKMFSKVGTSSYKAPEVVRCSTAGYNEKCDVWSLGITLFILCVSMSPWMKESDVGQQIIAGGIDYDEQSWMRVNQKFKHMAQAMLTKCVVSRPSVDDMLSDHEAWLARMGSRSMEACCSIS